MSSIKYLITIKDFETESGHTGFCALGHEIHLSRYILLDMLHNKYINENDVVVTVNDRKFLYSKLFRNVITIPDFNQLDTSNNIIIKLWPFCVAHPHSNQNEYNFLQEQIKEFESVSDYPIREKIFERFEHNFNHLISKIDYPIIPQPLLPINKFVMIHLRTIFTPNNNNNLDKNYKVLLMIISKIKEKYPLLDIYIFSSKNVKLDIPNIKIVRNLAVYASLMNHDLCKAVISEGSGGGEFSQYCHNKKIYIFGCLSYGSLKNIIIPNMSLRQNEKLLHTEWPRHGVTTASLNCVLDINTLLENLNLE